MRRTSAEALNADVDRRLGRGRRLIVAVLAALVTGASAATQVTSVSPQGEVGLTRQVSVKFDEAVVPFGDLQQADPATLACQGAVPGGAGRWANDRVWLYDFRDTLPPGVTCTLTLRADWKPLAGSLTGTTSFSFGTGGPAVVSVQPYDGAQIAEDQYFLLRLNGAATEASVAAKAWCEVEGIGEKIAVNVIAGDARSRVIDARHIDKTNAARTVILACQRPLPFEAAVRLVWGQGIAASANPAVTTRIEQRYRFKVRPAFTAEFSCERERANAPCLPVRAMSLRFSAPVARELAAQVKLQPASGNALAPVFDKDDKATEVSQIKFPMPLPENARFTVELPAALKDNAGRTLANAASFPLKVATGDAPPIAKFAAAPFGIVELNADAMLPVTLRHVQGDMRPAASGGQVRIKTLTTDAEILAAYKQVQHWRETQLSARELGLPQADWFALQTETDARGRSVQRRVERFVATREVSMLQRDAAARRLDLPQLVGGDPRPFEVIGIPLDRPGYHVVEIESARLGASLLNKPAPMFVRTGVLATNLGVHFKLGRENSVVWVTTLDRGRPVEGAEVAINDCSGHRLWSGQTDAQGLAVAAQSFDAGVPRCDENEGLFVTARKADTGPDGRARTDLAFVFSSWQKGIESWRFNQPTGGGPEPTARAATVLDRSLFRAGESVSMKHFFRLETSAGLALATPDQLPTQLKIVHEGTGQEFVQPLVWHGVRDAVSTWAIPPAAKLGVYRIELDRGDDKAGKKPGTNRTWTSGNFRVEEFRTPLVDARLSAPKQVPIAPSSLAVALQLNYFSGGGIAKAPVRASALLKRRAVHFADHDAFSFEPPRDRSRADGSSGGEDTEPDAEAGQDGARLIADKVALTTDQSGAATVALTELPKIDRPSEIAAEVSFNDPNGEVQTVATQIALWPSAVVLGIKTPSWASQRGSAPFTALALDTSGRPIKGQRIEVRGRLAQTLSSRKRMVGGFYAYDNRTETTELGVLCSGTTDALGLLACDAELKRAGEVELIARSTDAQGHVAESAASVWVTKEGELWFAQDNDDRIDVLPEKPHYEPGETARLQVRMPFREATALVSVEREGVLTNRVVTLRGNDPTVEVKIEKTWGPNVYVSVLALRGRIREVPWYSFFTWGWKEPLDWARSFWFNGREYQAPTALVDLAKPAFKLGVAALKVGIAAHELKVSVTTDKAQYEVRQKAIATIKVSAGGKPLAGTQVAFAAVDEGLLALRDNASWDLLGAMIQTRAWGVETSTAQSEIIGRRHYGRKAVAAGGGGGRSSTRELFDTLLVWQANVVLDANGEAKVEVPLNDSLTSFRLIAIADAGTAQFGSGSTQIRVTQDLQVLAGLPPLVREGDAFSAMLTLRNTTAREMTVRANLQGLANGTAITLPAQTVTLAAGSAKELIWPVDVPAGADSIAWTASANAEPGTAKDILKVTQRVVPAVPVRVLQATLQQLDGSFTMPVAAPADALPDAVATSGIKRGGVGVGVQPRLSGALPGMRRFFETYPFICLEQKTSKSVGLKDAALWATVADSLPTYLDRDGLASYFPPRADEAPHGSDSLTAYLLSATHEAGFALPAAAKQAMLDGLAAFVEGRIERKFWVPAFAKEHELDVRKLAAIDALARHGRAQPRMLGSINITPTVWPTAALINWLDVLKRMDGIPNQTQRLSEANQILRSRLTFAGTTLKFSTEEGDFWWWLMDSADANAARLILTVIDDPAWRDDLPRLVLGALARQQRGAWLTTTANLWGSLALDKFAATFESTAITGSTVATTGSTPARIDWAAQPSGGVMTLPWTAQPATLKVTQEGTGKPWLTVQSLAAIPLKAPIRAGYSVARSVTAVERKDPNRWSRGDVLRVRLEIDAQSDMTWVVVSDPVPGGAAILGGGLGRDSAIAARGEKREGDAWPAFEERSFEAFRSYCEFLPRGRHVVEYTVRLNNAGRFALPPTRIEAMYSPETFGELPNAAIEVGP